MTQCARYHFRLQRKDMLQLMLDAKEETGGEKIDNDDIQAQSLVFLLAGYDTSSTTLAFACYQLSLNTHVQDKLRDEIDRMWPGDEVDVMKWCNDTLRTCFLSCEIRLSSVNTTCIKFVLRVVVSKQANFSRLHIIFDIMQGITISAILHESQFYKLSSN